MRKLSHLINLIILIAIITSCCSSTDSNIYEKYNDYGLVQFMKEIAWIGAGGSITTKHENIIFYH